MEPGQHNQLTFASRLLEQSVTFITLNTDLIINSVIISIVVLLSIKFLIGTEDAKEYKKRQGDKVLILAF